MPPPLVITLQPTVMEITAPSTLIPVRRLYTSTSRKPITFKASNAHNSGWFFRITADAPIQLYEDANTNTPFTGTVQGFQPNLVLGDEVDASGNGLTLYAEATASSVAVDHETVTLEAWDPISGTPLGCNVTKQFTGVDVPIKIYQSRPMPGVFGVPLGQPESYTAGRVLHKRMPTGEQGRAFVEAGPVQPPGLAGTIEVTGNANALSLFPNEHPTPNEVAIPIPAGTHLPQNGQIAGWLEGKIVSGAPGDLGIRVGVDGAGPEIDRVAITVVTFSNLVATLPTSQPHTLNGNGPRGQAGNPAVLPQQFLAGDPFDTNFSNNSPLVLLEGTLRNPSPGLLSAQIIPAAIVDTGLVRWSVIRNAADEASLPNRGAHTEPTLSNPVGIATTMLSDSVGSFRVRIYVDQNHNNKFDEGADNEPSAVMNLILVRIEKMDDNSRASTDNLAYQFLNDNNGKPSFKGSSGDNNVLNPGANAVAFNGQVHLIGGGPLGRLGLERVYGCWLQNMTAPAAFDGIYRAAGPGPPPNHLDQRILVTNANLAAATGYVAAPWSEAVFVPAGNPAPLAPAWPVLDAVAVLGAPAGVGGESACLTYNVTPDEEEDIGYSRTYVAVDSPKDYLLKTHLGFPGPPASDLLSADWDMSFTTYLAFWTNTQPNTPAPTNAASDGLYGILYSVDWTLQTHWTVDWPNLAAARFGDSKTASDNGASLPLSVPEVEGAETRGFTALDFYARDERF